MCLPADLLAVGISQALLNIRWLTEVWLLLLLLDQFLILCCCSDDQLVGSLIAPYAHLAAELAEVLGVLADLHLLDDLTETRTIASTVLAGDADLLGTLRLR